MKLLSKSFIVLLLLFNPGWAMDQRELTIKGAYLFRLSLFVEWPASSLNLAGPEPVFFCIAGGSDISQHLKAVLTGKSINRHKISVTEVGLKDDLSFCHLLYIPELIETPKPFLQETAPYPVLTVGESEAFYRQGGMVFLFNKNNTIHFSINEQAVRNAGLKFKAQLLHLADQ